VSGLFSQVRALFRARAGCRLETASRPCRAPTSWPCPTPAPRPPKGVASRSGAVARV